MISNKKIENLVNFIENNFNKKIKNWNIDEEEETLSIEIENGLTYEQIEIIMDNFIFIYGLYFDTENLIIFQIEIDD